LTHFEELYFGRFARELYRYVLPSCSCYDFVRVVLGSFDVAFI